MERKCCAPDMCGAQKACFLLFPLFYRQTVRRTKIYLSILGLDERTCDLHGSFIISAVKKDKLKLCYVSDHYVLIC